MTPDQREKERSVAALVAPDIQELLETDASAVAVETEELHPADLADIAELLPPELLPRFLTALPAGRAAAGVKRCTPSTPWTPEAGCAGCCRSGSCWRPPKGAS